VIVPADTEFGTLLALGSGAHPSVVLLRNPISRRPERQCIVLVANLLTITEALAAGGLVVIDGVRIRLRRFPTA